jgi:hypothetical protein
VLKRRKSADRRPSALALEQAVHQRLPECSLLDLPGAKVRHMSSPGHSCQTLTSHEDQKSTLKPDRRRRDGVQPESPRPARARSPVITSSGTPHPHQPEPKLTRKPG